MAAEAAPQEAVITERPKVEEAVGSVIDYVKRCGNALEEVCARGCGLAWAAAA
jgi:hypothetical protein